MYELGVRDAKEVIDLGEGVNGQLWIDHVEAKNTRKFNGTFREFVDNYRLENNLA